MKGFTLVEVLIMAAVGSVAGILLVSVWVQNNGLFFQQTSKISQGININDAAAQISDLIRAASEVVSSNPIGSPTYTTSSTTLVLKIPSFDSSGNLLNNVYDYAVVTQDLEKPTYLRKIIFKDQASFRVNENRILANNLINLVFLYLDDNYNPVSPASASKINFTINLKDKAGLGNQESSVSGEMNLRNN